MADQQIYHQWASARKPSPPYLQRIAATLDQELPYQPLISILVPTYNTPEKYLRAMVDSVVHQVYPYWELCIADDCSPNPRVREVLQEYADRDPRVKLAFRQENGHIVHASNSALALATGEFVGLLDHDDLLTPDALYEVVKLLNVHPEADMIYTDEDKVTERGELCSPTWKPAWCPESMLSRMYTCHFSTFRRSILLEIGGFRPGYEGSQDYDLVLRFTEKTDRVFHIPKMLYHWRIHAESAAATTDAKPYAYEAAVKALGDALQRRGTPGMVAKYTKRPGHYLICYDVKNSPLASIIVPFRDSPYLLKQCVESIVEKTNYPNYEIVLVDNGSEEPGTHSLVRHWMERSPEKVQYVVAPGPFNLSRLNNRGAAVAQGSFLVFFQSDMAVKENGWLTGAVGQAQWADIGAVGGFVWYGNDTLRTAGIVLGQGDRPWSPYHAWKPRELADYHIHQIGLTNNVSALSGAGLVCRRAAFEAVGGFDEALPVVFGDVDFCLRLRSQGLRNVYRPDVELIHHGLRTWAVPLSTAEQEQLEEDALVHLRHTWGEMLDSDPCVSPVWMPLLFDQCQRYDEEAAKTRKEMIEPEIKGVISEEEPFEEPLVVSICIPTYNGERYLRAALDSAITQSYGEIEILVADGGSTDRTVEIAREYQAREPQRMRVSVRSQPGMVENWNACASLARGKYIKFLHQDDTLAFDCVAKMALLAEQDPTIAIVFCQRNVVLDEAAAENGRCQAVARESQLKLWPGFEQGVVQLGHHLLGWSELLQQPINKLGEPTAVLIRRDVFQQLGGFNESLCQLTDVEMWLRILGDSNNYKVGYVAEPLAQWRVHPDQATQQNISGQRITEDWLKFHQIVATSRYCHLLHPKSRAILEFHLGQRIADIAKTTPSGGGSEKTDSGLDTTSQTCLTGPLVSICIPTHNGQNYLRAALESAATQTYDNVEIVVCDDGSVDQTIGIARAFKAEHLNKVRVYTRSSTGMVGNWNACASLAKGKYIKFLHQDDELTPDCIEKMVALAEQDSEIALVFCKREIVVEEEATNDSGCQWVAQGAQPTMWPAFENSQVQLCSKMLAWPGLLESPFNNIGEPSVVLMRRDIFVELGGFNAALCQLTDMEMWLRILGYSATCKVAHVPQPLARWRIHLQQATQKNLAEQRISKDLQDFCAIVTASSYYHSLHDQSRRILAHYAAPKTPQSNTSALEAKSFAGGVNRAIATIKAYSQNPADSRLLAQVRSLRLQLINLALQLATAVRVTPQSLDQLWTGEFATLHQALRHSGILHGPLDAAETAPLNRLLTALPAVPDNDMPRLIAMLTAATLLRYPYQLPGMDRDWSALNTVASRYSVLLLDVPDYFGELGALDRFREYTTKLWRSLRIQIEQNRHDLTWQKIGQRLTNYGVITPLYFTRETDREIYRDRAQIIEATLEWSQPEPLDWTFGPRPSDRRRVRIGILRNHWLPGTESFSTLPAFEHLDRDRFEIVLYTLHATDNDVATQSGATVAGMVALPASLPEQVNAIRTADLDILWIGTNVTMVTNGITLLAAFRLARMQVTSINSPTTTGFRNVDVYFGGQMSLGASYGKYYETAIALPGSGICFSRPAAMEVPPSILPSRQDWGADDNTVVLMSGANFNKLLPEMRAIWTRILAALPQARLVLYPYNPNWQNRYPGDRFREDFSAQLREAGVDPERLVILDPMAGTADIRQCLRQGDVYLDSLPYGGATSLLDPIDVEMPMVVFEGDVLRFRQASSLLRELGQPVLDELIATTVDDYVAKAIALGQSAGRRQVVTQALVNAKTQTPPFLDSQRYGRAIAPILETLVTHWTETRLPALSGASSATAPEILPKITWGSLPTDRLVPLTLEVPDTVETPALPGPAVPPLTLPPALTRPQLQQLGGTLSLWRICPTDGELITQVRQWREVIANAWQAIAPDTAEALFQQVPGQAYKLMMGSGIQKLEWTMADQQRVEPVIAHVQASPRSPDRVGAYMILMLYLKPGSFTIDQPKTCLPEWLYPVYAQVFEPSPEAQPQPTPTT